MSDLKERLALLILGGPVGEWIVELDGKGVGAITLSDDGRFKASVYEDGRIKWLSASEYMSYVPFDTFAQARAHVQAAVLASRTK